MNCKSCWWQEGGRCYEGKFERLSNGRSPKMANEICCKYKNKREALSQVIPNDKLIILSEVKR